MKNNLKHDWNKIVAFHLNDDGRFLEELRFMLKSLTEEEFVDVNLDYLTEDGRRTLLRIHQQYTKTEKEELLKKLQVFSDNIYSIPLTELPEFSIGPTFNFIDKMKNEEYREKLIKSIYSIHAPES